MTNEQLTQQYNNMVASLAVMESKLGSIIPEMDKMNTETKSLAEDIKTQLKTHVDPIINADVINNIVKLDNMQQAIVKSLDDQIAGVKDDLQKVRELTSDDVGNSKLINDQAAAQSVAMSQKFDAMQQTINNMGYEFAAEKTSSDSRYASTQSQIATIHASASAPSSSGSGRKQGEPIVCHKLMMNKTLLSRGRLRWIR